MAEQKFLTNLDVAGTIDLNNLTINSAQGTDGQVLTSTGTGIAWEDASGGSSQPTRRYKGISQSRRETERLGRHVQSQ